MGERSGDDEPTEPGFAPHPRFPQHPEFYRRVLEEFPSPAAVFDELGCVIYANRAAREASGWTLDELVGQNMLTNIHPDEQAWATEVYIGATESAPMGEDEPAWGTVLMHGIDAHGVVTPIEVTGANGLQDPYVGGLVYELRPAWSLELLERAVTGLAAGQAVDELLDLVVTFVSRPPLDIAAAIVDHSDRYAPVVVAASADGLHALARAGGEAPWDQRPADIVPVSIADLPPSAAGPLTAAGYADIWCQAIETIGEGAALSLVALTRPGIVYAHTVQHRLEQGHDLARVVLQRARLDQMMDHAANHDGLTGLANRTALYGRLVERSAAGPVGLIYLDLDGFKAVNDRWGHLVGDQLLQAVADRLRAVTRPTDLAGRLGGDEFAVVIGPGADVDVVEELGRRVVEAIGRPVAVGGPAGEVSVGASIGMALGAPGVDADALLSAADAAMYAAKRGEPTRGGVELVGIDHRRGPSGG